MLKKKRKRKKVKSEKEKKGDLDLIAFLIEEKVEDLGRDLGVEWVDSVACCVFMVTLLELVGVVTEIVILDCELSWSELWENVEELEFEWDINFSDWGGNKVFELEGLCEFVGEEGVPWPFLFPSLNCLGEKKKQLETEQKKFNN
mgnify:CR=1 FL=1